MDHTTRKVAYDSAMMFKKRMFSLAGIAVVRGLRLPLDLRVHTTRRRVFVLRKVCFKRLPHFIRLSTDP
jgi:hypothetical protein